MSLSDDLDATRQTVSRGDDADTLPTAPAADESDEFPSSSDLRPQTDRLNKSAITLPLEVSGDPGTAATIRPASHRHPSNEVTMVSDASGGYRRDPSRELTLLADDVAQPDTGALRRSGSYRHYRTKTVLSHADDIIRGSAQTVRINPRLPRDTQVLDEHLQLSRHSVYVQLLQKHGTQNLPGTVRLRLEHQDTIGRYTVEKPLAAGGMGAVLSISDEDFNRRSAMKVMHARYADNQESLERFLEEAQITAQLEHPNIVPVHDVGMTGDGTLYYTMKLIHGQSLGGIIKERRRGDQNLRSIWTDEHCLLTFLKVLEGMGYAHSRGVIHRDLKPDNIMIEDHGEVLIVDWGIAKTIGDDGFLADDDDDGEGLVQGFRTDDAIGATRTGAAIGTPYYMPPEQATGDKRHMGRHSDIYALGVTLYELLTLVRPIVADTTQDMLPLIVSGISTDIKVHRPELSDDLAAIVHKAMSCEPDQRYQSCADFADDLRRYLTGRAVAARRRNWIERLGAWITAHRRQTRVAAALILAITAAAFGTDAWLRHQAAARAAVVRLAISDGLAQTLDAGALDHLRGLLIEARTLDRDHPDLAPLTEALATRQAQIDQEAARAAAAGLVAEARNLLSQARAAIATLPVYDHDAALRTGGRPAAALAAYDQLIGSPAGLLTQAGSSFRQAQQTGAALPDGVDADLQELGALLQTVRAKRRHAEQLGADYQAAIELLALARQQQSTGDLAKALELTRSAQLRFPLDQGQRMETQLAAALADAELARLQQEALVARDRAVSLLEAVGRLPADDPQRADLLDRAAQALHQAGSHRARGVVVDDLQEQQRQLVLLRERSEQARLQSARLHAARQEARQAMITARGAAERLPALRQQLMELEQRIDLALLSRSADTAARQRLQAQALDQTAAVATCRETILQEARRAIALLAPYPDEPLAAEAHRLLAADALERLQLATEAGDTTAAALAMDLLTAHDRDGSLLATLERPATVRISGAGATLARPLRPGPDTRVLVDASAPGTPIVDQQISLPPGAWRFGDQNTGLTWQLTAGTTVDLHLPSEAQLTLPMPIDDAAIAADYVPAADGGPGIWIGRYEITNLQYFAFIHDPAIFPQMVEHSRRLKRGTTDEPFPLAPIWWETSLDETGIIQQFVLKPDQLQEPVSGISRADASAFCAWLGARSGRSVRLPSRAEWQRTAGANDPQRRWTWGPVFDPAFCISAHDGLGHAAGVGSRPGDRGPYGHYDLAGNCREWLLDSEPTRVNFHGALIAGGGWGDYLPERFAVDAIESVPPDARYQVIGFRICIEP